MRRVWFQLFLILCAALEVHCTRDSSASSNATIITVTMTNHGQFWFTESHEFPSLDDLVIPRDLASDTTITATLHANGTELNTEKEFSHVLEVSLNGGDDQSEIWCRGDSAGLKFTMVTRVYLERIKMRGCGISLEQGGTTKAGMIVIGASHVTIHDSTVTNPTEMGIALIDVTNSEISNCTFNRDTYTGDRQDMGSGLYLEVTGRNTSHIIGDCNFTGDAEVPAKGRGQEEEGNEETSFAASCWNKSGENAADAPDPDILAGGAGVKVRLKGLSNFNSILVTGCSFEQNYAQWGGAVYIDINDSSSDNMVTVSGSKFSKNCATAAGGAIAACFLDHALATPAGAPPTKNTVQIAGCNFTGNTAPAGGAVQLLYSPTAPSEGETETRIQIELNDCRWEENTAHHGAAIDARPINVSSCRLVPPQVTLRDCNFVNNSVEWRVENGVRICGAGTVKLKMAELTIEGTLEVNGCTGSALHLESSTVGFANSSNSTFTGNEGHYGAAIAMVGGQRSAMSVEGNSYILFRDNKAETFGGAVFQESSRYCFISRRDGRNGSSSIAESRAVMEFDNNMASAERGCSVFVNSLIPCMEATQTENYQEALASIAELQFNTGRCHDVSTPGKTMLSNVTFPPAVIPGKLVPLKVYMLDDTNTQAMLRDPHVVAVDSPDIEVLRGNSSIKILGKPRTKVTIAIIPLHKQEVQLVVTTTLSACPPGYFYDTEQKTCICSSNSIDNRYVGIQACNHQEFHATLLHSHWAGYMKGEGHDDEEMVFRTAYCPRGFCARSEKTHKGILLPSQVTDYDLSSYVCRENRAGVFCSVCIANHSANFPRTVCRRNEHCKLGGLYYVLSQILPATILFSLLLAFDLSLTSGLVGGVIFYMQMIDALLLTANDFLWFEPPVYKILVTLRVLSRTTNLLFFAHKNFSFCLWEGATTLDAIAFNYIIVIYSFLMVLFTVKVVNPLVLRIKKFYRRQTGITKRAGSRSIIHGLTGFLVLCYSLNTHISLFLLAPHTPRGRGGEGGIGRRVFFKGEFGFFEKEHLPYAIPALFMLLTITILPPLLLLFYPLCYRVFALCRIQESKVVRVLCRAVPLEKYKPLFDSFQGSFKDNHRYFAGFYFMYRLAWLVTLAYVRELATFYVILEIELILMLFLTAYLQPHKNKWHNRIDASIFALLAIVNSCTIYSYHKRNDYTDPSNDLRIISGVQIVLACLPPLSVVAYLTSMGVVRVAARFTRRKQWRSRGGISADEEHESVEMELQRSQMLSRSHSEEKNSTGYKLFADKM